MNYNKYQPNIFPEASECWNLEELYAVLEKIKQRIEKKPLTLLEQSVLRGILSGNTPEEIASFLPGKFSDLILNSTQRLYRYIQTLTGTEIRDVDVNKYQHIPKLLEAAGYKQSPLTDRLEPPSQETLQGGRQSLSTNSWASNRLIAETGISNSTTEIISTTPVSQAALSEQCDLKQHSNTGLIKEEKDNNRVSRPIKPSKPEKLVSITQNSALSDAHTLSFVEADDFMPPISLWTKLGGIFMVGSVGIAIALSAFTPYQVTVKAQAKVRPAGELRIVEAETEGTVVEIAVNENQKVKKGDLLANIDNSRLETQKSQLESNIHQATLQLRQIKAQITAQENRILAETKGINRAIASAQAELTRNRREYRDQSQTANAEVAEAIANLNSTEEELNQAKTELISLQADLKSAQASLNAAKSKRDRYAIIADSGALSKSQLEEIQLDVQQKEQEIIAKQATIQQQYQEITRRQQAIVAAQARLNNSQIALNPSNAEVVIAQEKIEQEKAIGQATLSNLKREQGALIQQQIEIQQQQARDRQELQQLKKDLERTAIRATAEGIIFQLNLRNSGQTVTLGEKIAQIAPTDSSLIINALVPAQEIDQVKIDQKVQMKVSACPYPDYGTLKGVVSDIAPDSIEPQDHGASDNNLITPPANLGSGLYPVTIKPESLALAKGKKHCVIQLGMEGQADIIAQEETVLQFFLRKARLIVDF